MKKDLSSNFLSDLQNLQFVFSNFVSEESGIERGQGRTRIILFFDFGKVTCYSDCKYLDLFASHGDTRNEHRVYLSLR